MQETPMMSNMLRAQMRQLSTATRLCSSKLYELRIYSFKTSDMKALSEHCRAALPTRYSHSVGLGYFFSEIGALGESVHVWEYDNYQHRADVRKKLAADPAWTSSAAPMIKLFNKQDNMTMRLFPWSPVQTDVDPGGVYFFYSFTFLPNLSADTISEQLQSFINETDLTALSAWKEELGRNPLRNAYALFHSSEYDSEKNPALASPSAWSKLNQYTSHIHGRLLTPADWSSYK